MIQYFVLTNFRQLKKLSIRMLLCLVILSLFSIAQADVLLVANKSANTVSLFNSLNNTLIKTLPTGEAPHEIAISPNNQIAAITNYGVKDKPGNTITLVDIKNRKVLKTLDIGDYKKPHGIEWLNDNKTLVVTVEANQGIVLVDADSNKVESFISTEQNISHMLDVDNNGTRAYVSSIGSGSVSVIDLKRKLLIKNISTGKGAEGIALTKDERWLWVTNRGDNNLSIIDTKTLKIVRELNTQNFPIRIEMSNDGKMALIANAFSDSISVFDVQKQKLLKNIPMTAAAVVTEGRLITNKNSSIPIGVQFNLSSPLAYVAQANADQISIIDLTSLEVTKKVKTGREPDGMGYAKF